MDEKNKSGGSPMDPFTQYWTDMMAKMSQAGMQAQAATQEEMGKQMRQAFFDAWAKACEDMMRSDVFLDAMKKSMEGALQFKQQMNEFLRKAMGDSPLPSRDDTESIILAVRRLEGRVLDRLEELSERVEALEDHVGSKPAGAKQPAKARAKGGSR